MADSDLTMRETADAPPPKAPPPGATPPRAQPKPGADWWGEIKGVFWLVLAVLAFHSFLAKPFYIPSESMMPNLLKGDRLVVTKYPYGWSWVSPSFHVLPFINGRLFGKLPKRGDIVIVTPPGESSDYIKRVIGLPGDRIAVRNGQVILNGVALRREARPDVLVPVDANAPCEDERMIAHRVVGPSGKLVCALPVMREWLPDGRNYDTLDLGYFPTSDEYDEVTVPPNRVFLMGDNRDESADSRFSIEQQGLGGPVPWENLGGRAEFITFSLDGTSELWNPLSWITAMRGGRAGTSLHPASQ